MYRFVALSWNSKDPARTAEAHRLGGLLRSASHDLQPVLDLPGLRVFHALQPGGIFRAYVLPRKGGVILGRLFDRQFDDDRPPSEPTFDDRESNLLVETEGHRLVERYWGNYVAVLRPGDGERCLLIRDPTGGLPCYLTNVAGVDVMLSDMHDCALLNPKPFSVDWDHLSAFFVHDRLVTRTTGFKDVSQVHAGECIVIGEGRVTRSFHWDPVDVCKKQRLEDPEEARAALRTAILHCVNAWASCYRSIVHDLSGGLDSSIVAACLARARAHTDVLCFHYYTEMAEGDERPYARAAAQSAGFELIEREIRVAEISLEGQLNRAKVATPAVLGFVPASETLKEHLVTQRHAGAIFSGQGGDHLFQQTRSKLIAAEYAHRRGLRLPLLRIVWDASRFTKQSFWSVFGTVVGHGLLRQSFDPYAVYYKAPSILSDEVRTSLSVRDYGHPWVENAGQLPASKIQQVFYLVDCQVFYLYPCPYAEQIHPLMSQPVIECCLQIPTYVLAHRGRPRGLVREAFERDVPAKIIHRHSKGGVTSYFNRMIVENAAFLRELLLDGALVNEGLLDRVELEKQLSERELIRGSQLIPILNAARAETWLRIWTDVGQRTAA